MGKRFSLLYSVETGSGAHPASYPIGIRDYFSGVKRLGREASHCTSTPLYVFVA
jgi:hypothetical protein